MGAIRGILLVVVSVLLLISLLAGNTFLTLSMSMDASSIQEELSSDILDSVSGDIDVKGVIEEKIPAMQEYCENKTEFSFEDPNRIGKSFIIPCDVVSQGSDAIVEYGVDAFVKEIYYEDYDCGFWDCFEKTGSPLFLISAKAQNYWNNKFYFFLLVSIILIILIFFLVEKKSNLFIVSGSLFVLSSLPFMKLDWVLSFFSGKPFLELLAIFFKDSYTVFVISLVFGIIVLGIGILFKLFKVGFKISDICSKFSKKDKKVSEEKTKQIVKKEISEKEKIKPNKKLQISKILEKDKKSK